MAKNKQPKFKTPRYQIKVYREGERPAWLFKKDDKFMVVLEAEFATKYALLDAKQVVRTLQPTLPLTTALEITDAIYKPVKQKQKQPSKPPASKPVKEKSKSKSKYVKRYYIPPPKPIEHKNPFPEGKIDFNSEKHKVNEPVDCRNCGICRVCLGL